MTLPELCNHLMEHAAHIYEAGIAGLRPVCHAENARGEVFVIGLMFGDDTEKCFTLAMLRKFFADNKVVRYGIVSEAWAATYDRNTEPSEKRRARDREDRMEIVTVAGADMSGQRLSLCRMLLRDGDGKPSLGGPLPEFGDSLMHSGSMLQLLEIDFG